MLRVELQTKVSRRFPKISQPCKTSESSATFVSSSNILTLTGDGFLLAALVPGGQLRVEPEDGLRVEQTRPVQRAGVRRGGRGNTEEKM